MPLCSFAGEDFQLASCAIFSKCHPTLRRSCEFPRGRSTRPHATRASPVSDRLNDRCSLPFFFFFIAKKFSRLYVDSSNEDSTELQRSPSIVDETDRLFDQGGEKYFTSAAQKANARPLTNAATSTALRRFLSS